MYWKFWKRKRMTVKPRTNTPRPIVEPAPQPRLTPIGKLLYVDSSPNMERTLEQIEAELENARESYDKKFNEPSVGRSWDDFLRYSKKEIEDMGRLSREKRMMMPYELDEIPDYADVMPLKEFIACVDGGGFIDYDGFGHYVLDGKETNITIQPSDVKHGAVRWEFDSVAWYNR